MDVLQALHQWVSMPWVAVVLLSIGLLGIAVEVVTQHGIAGVIGLLSLGILFLGRVEANLSQLWFVILFVVGIGLLLVELHVLPGHGVSGILGLGLILTSLIFLLGGNGEAAKQVFLSLVIALVVFFSILHYLPKAPLFSKLVLKANVGAPTVLVGGANVDKKEGSEDLHVLIGKTGITLSNLHPSGIVLIEKKRYSALAEGGEFLPVETQIKVCRLEGTSLVVEKHSA
jgi:membrane-bound serine protease (ClpP class)